MRLISSKEITTVMTGPGGAITTKGTQYKANSNFCKRENELKTVRHLPSNCCLTMTKQGPWMRSLPTERSQHLTEKLIAGATIIEVPATPMWNPPRLDQRLCECSLALRERLTRSGSLVVRSRRDGKTWLEYNFASRYSRRRKGSQR